MMQIRIQLVSDDPARPPEYVFTDQNGRFVFQNLLPDYGYKVVVESDGKNWGRTEESFLILGPRHTLSITLRPPERTPNSPESSVSISRLKQDVPRAARKEYENAVESLNRGEQSEARQQLEHAIELFPDYVEARNELAVMLLREERLAEAEAQLRRALAVDGDAVRPLLNLGLCLYRQQRYKDAIEPLERAMQLHPINPSGNMLFGMVLVQAGNDKDAEAVFLRSYEQGGKRVARAQLYLSRIYTRRQDYDRAANALDVYLTDVPDEPNAQELRATLVKLRAARKQ
jgi:Tfp pilus assembly protein PilF